MKSVAVAAPAFASAEEVGGAGEHHLGAGDGRLLVGGAARRAGVTPTGDLCQSSFEMRRSYFTPS